jgi:two-component system NtrC family sensor kinase
MPRRVQQRTRTDAHPARALRRFRLASQGILHDAHRGLLRTDFLSRLTKKFLGSCGCDSVEVRVTERGKEYRCEFVRGSREPAHFEVLSGGYSEHATEHSTSERVTDLDHLCHAVNSGRLAPTVRHRTKYGSFWTGDTAEPVSIVRGHGERPSHHSLSIGGDYRSLAVIPIGVAEERAGLVLLKTTAPNRVSEEDMEFCEGLAQTAGLALAHRRAQVALRERVKELTCLWGIGQAVARPDRSLEQILREIVRLLPHAWLYPDSASVRITLDEHSYSTRDFRENPDRMVSNIVVNGSTRGAVEIAYRESKPELDEGPFLKEERNLIDTIAKELSLIIERRQTEEEKARLQDQLRHADRLATIGQLAAGVAHELNEPLGTILGFAQLAMKPPDLPQQTLADIERIIKASLHAREVVKKLMLFARQMPPRKADVNLNQVVEEALYVLESRCAKEDIKLVRDLSQELPSITADRSQLDQVLVNLVVNAIQAMPKGGTVTLKTRGRGQEGVTLVVEDTGVGMDEETLSRIFVPFFTTKEVGEGTGLGLPVVHGIVTAHGGRVEAYSEMNIGTRFEIHLPLAGAQHEEGDTSDGT